MKFPMFLVEGLENPFTLQLILNLSNMENFLKIAIND